jgi:hypothetical protein
MLANNDAYCTSEDLEHAQKGMKIEPLVHLPGFDPGPGSVIKVKTWLARFVDNAMTANGRERMTGSWWWGFTEIRKTWEQSRREGVTIQDSIRSNGAILDSFRNGCNYMVCVRTRVPLRVYTGKGMFVTADSKPVEESTVTLGTGGGCFGGAVTRGDAAIPASDYEQLYIPGLSLKYKGAVFNSIQWLEFKASLNMVSVSKLLIEGNIAAVGIPNELWQL